MFTVVTNLLLNQSTEACIKAAAQEINQLSLPYPKRTWEDSVRGTKGRSFEWKFWREVCFTARQIPYDCPARETLVRFVAALRNVPNDVDEKWGELHYLGWEAREALNDIQQGSQEELNFYSFAAKLTRDTVQDFSLWAIWSFRDTLEDEQKVTAPAWWRAQAAQKAAPRLDAQIPVVALWIEVIGDKLFRYGHYLGRAAQGEGSWKNKKAGFCLERWQLWKSRLAEISASVHVTEKTRETGRATCDKMSIIEGNNQGVFERADIFTECMIHVDPSAFGTWAYDAEAERRRSRGRRN